MTTRKWITTEELTTLFNEWPGNGRNADDLRFGQYLVIHYDGIPGDVFNTENAAHVYDFMVEFLSDVQR